MPPSNPLDFTGRFRSWCFTYNNYEDLEGFKQKLIHVPNLSYAVFQQEVGEAGTPHLQGVLGLTNTITFRALKTKLGVHSIHLERAKDVYASIDYCQKLDTRQPGTVPFAWGAVPQRERGGNRGMVGRPEVRVYTADELGIVSGLRHWQYGLRRMLLEQPDNRTIRWYWESDGGAGKTQFARYMVFHHNALYVQGAYKDVMCSLSLWREKKGDFPTIVFLDIPREKKDYISYQSIEGLKNGVGFSSKYESGMLLFPPMHVVVFANFAPSERDLEKLSADRWRVTEIMPASLDMYDMGEEETQGYMPQGGLPSPGDLFGIEF